MEKETTNTTTAEIDEAITEKDLNRIIDLVEARGPEFIAALRRRMEKEPAGEPEAETPLWLEWLESTDENGPKFFALIVMFQRLLHHANPEIRTSAKGFLAKWEAAAFSRTAVKELLDWGYEVSADLLMELAFPEKKQTEPKDEDGEESKVVSFFVNLSDRDKLLCSTYNNMLCTNGGCNTENPKTLVDNIAKEIESYDPDAVKDDPDGLFLLGLNEMATLSQWKA